jgi:hypothetical protein
VDESKATDESNVVGAGLREKTPLHCIRADYNPDPRINTRLAVKVPREEGHSKGPCWPVFEREHVLISKDTSQSNRSNHSAVLDYIEAGRNTCTSRDTQNYLRFMIQQYKVWFSNDIERRVWRPTWFCSVMPASGAGVIINASRRIRCPAVELEKVPSALLYIGRARVDISLAPQIHVAAAELFKEGRTVFASLECRNILNNMPLVLDGPSSHWMEIRKRMLLDDISRSSTRTKQLDDFMMSALYGPG